LKTCIRCGISNSEESQYCIQCGQNLNQSEASPTQANFASPSSPEFPSQQVHQSQNYQTPYQQNVFLSPIDTFSSNQDKMQRIRELASSQLMLFLIILWFVKVAFFILSNVIQTSNISNILMNFNIRQHEVLRLNSLFNQLVFVSSLTGMLPTILVGIGLIMIYNSAGNKTTAMSTSGITLIKVIYIIQLVLTCVLLAFLLTVSIVLAGRGVSNTLGERLGYYELNSVISVIGVLLIVAILIVGALIIIFNIMVLKFLNSLSSTVRTGIPQEKCASVLSVLLFIAAGFSALGVFSSLSQLAIIPGLGIASFALSATNTAVYLMLGILINKYKDIIYSAN
jgi:hypothetical protein